MNVLMELLHRERMGNFFWELLFAGSIMNSYSTQIPHTLALTCLLRPFLNMLSINNGLWRDRKRSFISVMLP